VRAFETAPETEFVLPAPGSHIDVEVAIGADRQVRSYSVLGVCPNGAYRIAVKRLADSRGGAAYLWSLVPGDALSIAGPWTFFPLAADRPDYLPVAGGIGIGITPIYAMTVALARAEQRYRVLYACRSRRDLALASDLRDRIGDRLRLFISEEGARIDFTAAITELHPEGELYVCGPIGMLTAVRDAWRDSGGRWPCCASRPSAEAATCPRSASRSGSPASAARSWSVQTRRSWMRRRRPASR
jgi:vanillate O-demethylase ferredoxin subunit